MSLTRAARMTQSGASSWPAGGVSVCVGSGVGVAVGGMSGGMRSATSEVRDGAMTVGAVGAVKQRMGGGEDGSGGEAGEGESECCVMAGGRAGEGESECSVMAGGAGAVK